jgi:hypothetical protein
MSALPTLIDRIRSEYIALPGLKLTAAQARRLWPANEDLFGAAMEALVAEGFLRRLPSGTYICMPRPDGASARADVPPRGTDYLLRCPHCQKLNSVHRERTIAGHSATTTLRCAACGRIVTLAPISRTA